MNKKPFGTLSDRTEASLYTITNGKGMTAEITDYGASIVSLTVPDRNGNGTNVVLGYADAAEYERNSASFGAVVGRNCNRIANARMVVEGVTYELEQNDNENNLHSGSQSASRRIWDVAEQTDSRIVFRIEDADLRQGYPGNAVMTVAYELTDSALSLTYHGEADKTTIFNMTNHAYFNLNGAATGSALDQVLSIRASHYTPIIDAKAIPTGEIASVEGTPFDFRTPKAIGRDIGIPNEQLTYGNGYDHNFVLDRDGDGMETVATVTSQKTGICMDVVTDCIGLQLYTANFIEGQTLRDGTVCHSRDAFCLETQYFPNSINEPNFPTPLTKANTPYDSKTVYSFRTV